MNQREFLKRIRRIGRNLELRPNRLGLRRPSEHPESLQVWDVSKNGHPYFVMAICDENGWPREACAPDIERLRGMDGENVHGGWNGWGTHMARQSLNEQEARDQQASDDWDDRWKHDVRDRVRRRCGWGQAFPAATVGGG